MLAYQHFSPCALFIAQSFQNGSMLLPRDC